MTMNTTPDTLDLPEREQQPVMRVVVLMFPSEMYAIKDKLNDLLQTMDASDPAVFEFHEGLRMFSGCVSLAVKDMEAAGIAKEGA